VTVRGEVVRDATQDQGVGHSVHDRVEERATLARALRRLGDWTVEEVVESGEREQHNGDPEVARAIIQAVAKEKTSPENVRTSAENPMRTNHRPVGSVTVSTDFLKFPSSIDLRIPSLNCNEPSYQFSQSCRGLFATSIGAIRVTHAFANGGHEIRVPIHLGST